LRVTDFEGSWLYGPKAFAEITGRKKLWAGPSRAVDWLQTCSRRRSCPLCGEDATRRLFAAPGGVYERCGVCGMVYVPLVPTEADLEQFYRSAPEPQQWAKVVQINRIENMLDRRKFWWALDRAGWQDPRAGRLLDVGCSTGTLLSVADAMKGSKPGLALVGVEPNDSARGTAQEFVSGGTFLRRLDLVDGYFDLVSLWEVVEHVLDPVQMLRDAVAHLARHRGATLMVCVPNINSLAARLLHESAPMFGPGHVNMFSPDTLRSAILEALPGAKITMTSIISWSKEIRNWMNLTGPFEENDPQDMGEEFDPEAICKENLEGYKLVAWARA